MKSKQINLIRLLAVIYTVLGINRTNTSWSCLSWIAIYHSKNLPMYKFVIVRWIPHPNCNLTHAVTLLQ